MIIKFLDNLNCYFKNQFYHINHLPKKMNYFYQIQINNYYCLNFY
jgi:hypothetical protein